jgi:hypothetical protein
MKKLLCVLMFLFLSCSYQSERVKINIAPESVIALTSLVEVLGPIVITTISRDFECDPIVIFRDGTQGVLISKDLVRITKVGTLK